MPKMSIATILIHTPVWVWFVLAALIWRGLLATRSREAGLFNLLLLPLVLAGLSVSNIIGNGLSSAVLAGIGFGALVGVAAGLQLERQRPALAAGRGRLLLAGEWTTLAVVLVAFVSRYIKTATPIIDPALASSDMFQLVMTAISVCVSVMLLTRTALRLRLALGSPAITGNA